MSHVALTLLLLVNGLYSSGQQREASLNSEGRFRSRFLDGETVKMNSNSSIIQITARTKRSDLDLIHIAVKHFYI